MKKIIIGIDVSKEKCDATAILSENGIFEVSKLDYISFENRPCGFRRLLSWSRKLVKGIADDEILFVCEATGAYDHSMCEYLYSKGMDIWREAALKIKWSSGVRKGKNDTADSMMIAEYAIRHMDKMLLYESPDKRIVEIRALFLYRRRLEQERVSKLVRIKELEATAGKSEAIAFILRDAKKCVRMLEKSIQECETRMRQLIKEDEELNKNYEHLNSVKGLGLINITALMVYTNNFKNFRTARQMASYWGVASFRCQSGTSIDRRCDVRKLSNPMLKEYITQAIIHTVTENGIFHDYYCRLIERGKPKQVALNNAKNKLLHLAMSLVRNDRDYDKNHMTLHTEKVYM